MIEYNHNHKEHKKDFYMLRMCLGISGLNSKWGKVPVAESGPYCVPVNSKNIKYYP